MATVLKPVDTKKVARRTLHFNSLDEVLAEAERLVAGSPRMLGNWSLGQTLVHLARGLDMAVEPAPFRAPWYVRLVGPWLKTRFLTKPMSAGFKLPNDAASDFLVGLSSFDPPYGAATLRCQTPRVSRETPTGTGDRPVLGGAL